MTLESNSFSQVSTIFASFSSKSFFPVSLSIMRTFASLSLMLFRLKTISSSFSSIFEQFKVLLSLSYAWLMFFLAISPDFPSVSVLIFEKNLGNSEIYKKLNGQSHLCGSIETKINGKEVTFCLEFGIRVPVRFLSSKNTLPLSVNLKSSNGFPLST